MIDAVKLDLDKPSVSIIKGDAKCMSIAAASIIAKVTRDHLVMDFAKLHKEYLFEKHKGYGTKAHIEAIYKYGIIDGWHRKTFEPIKSLIKK